MAYIGNSPGVGSFIIATERFNGTGACTEFTITQTGISDANAIEVIVSSVQQDPINSYSIASGVITFTEPPPSGTQNILVTYRATTVITYSNVTASQLADGSITATKLASGVLPTATANSAASYANSAFAVANTGAGAVTSGSYANSGFAVANTAANNTIIASSYANSAFATANTAANNTINASLYANSGFAVANSAASYANGAFTKANNSLTAGANTATSVQLGSLGIGTAASGTTGEIRATNEITGYYASDARLKENVQTIENALDKLCQLNGVMFDWTDNIIMQRGGEDGYFVRKHDTGIIAQQVEEVLPEVVADRQDGYKAIKYEKMAGLIIQGINELGEEIKTIKERLARHGIT